MRKYYKECSANQFVQTASAQIPWSHNILILDKIKNDEQRIWYMSETLNKLIDMIYITDKNNMKIEFKIVYSSNDL